MNQTTGLPTLAELQQALSEVTGFPTTKFEPHFKLLDCATEIEQIEAKLGVAIKVRNYIKTTVAEIIDGMSRPATP